MSVIVSNLVTGAVVARMMLKKKDLVQGTLTTSSTGNNCLFFDPRPLTSNFTHETSKISFYLIFKTLSMLVGFFLGFKGQDSK